MEKELRYSVLIVDDEPDIRNGFRNILNWEEMGISLIGEAASEEEALSIIKNVLPTIVITDIVMKDITGLDIIQKVRESGNTATEFILISGYNEFKYAQKAISLGVAEYLLKPINPKELKNAIEKLLGKKENEHRAATDIEILKKNSRHLFIQHLINGELKNRTDIENGIKNYEIVLSDTNAIAITLIDRKKHRLLNIPTVCRYIFSHKIETIEEKNRTIIIMNSDERFALHFTRQILEILKEAGFTDFVAGIGTVCSSLLEISKSYNESIQAISYQTYGGDKKIFSSKDIIKERPLVSTSDLDIEKLSTLIRNANSESIKDYMDTFFASILFPTIPPPSYLKGMLFFLMNGVESYISKTERIAQQTFVAIRPDLTDNMLMLDDIKTSVVNYFLKLGNSVLPEARLSEDWIIRRCRKYVSDNLYCIISEEELSKELSLSLPYLSSYFSRAMGETFRHYVNKIKNEEAKKLLREGRSIKEISQLLGYSDYRSFNRIFKKINGESPSQWKKHSST